MDRISTSMLHCFYDHRLEMPFATYSESHLDSLTCAFTTSERGCGITTNEELRADRVCKRATLDPELLAQSLDSFFVSDDPEVIRNNSQIIKTRMTLPHATCCGSIGQLILFVHDCVCSQCSLTCEVCSDVVELWFIYHSMEHGLGAIPSSQSSGS